MASVALNRVLIVLGFIGIFIAGFLSASSFLKLSLPCGPERGCDLVTTHASAYLVGSHAGGGFPVSYLGLAGYLFLTGLALFRAFKGQENNRTLTWVGFLASALGTLYSGYLTYTAIYTIHATCLWCIASAATMMLTTLTYAAMLQSDPSPDKGSNKTDLILAGVMTVVVAVALGVGVMQQKARGEKLEGGLDTRINEGNIDMVTGGHIYGNKDAPVTVIEFADMLCPTCQQTYPVLEDLVRNSNGKVRMVFRHFPLFMKSDHKMALPAATIAEIASEEGKFWEFIAEVYSKSSADLQNVDAIVAIAQSVGLNAEKIKERMADPEDPAIKRVTNDLNMANKIKISSTPTIFIQAKGGPVEQVAPSKLEEKLNTEPYKSLILGDKTGQ